MASMTATAAEAGAIPARRRNPRLASKDSLIPFPEAARRLGRSPDTLRLWHDAGHCPAVVTPGGQWSTYESFIDAVLASARPGRAGVIEETAREWFAAHTARASGGLATTAASRNYVEPTGGDPGTRGGGLP
jgi:hypothetical protein